MTAAFQKQMQKLKLVSKMKSTTELLSKLRDLMNNTKYVPQPIQAYMVLSADAHFSEYTAEADKRRAFISGFKGNNTLQFIFKLLLYVSFTF